MAFTEEQLAELQQLIASAFTGDDFKTAMGAVLTPAVKAVVGAELKGLKIDDKLAAVRADLEGKLAGAAGAGADGDGGDSDDDGLPPAAKKRLDAVRAQLDKLTKSEERAREEAAAAQRARAEQQMLSDLRDALSAEGVGIPPRLQPKSIAWLRSQGLVSLNEDGTPVFRTKQAGYDVELSIAEGVAEWAKTDDARDFLPPAAGGGTGGKDPIQRAPMRGGAVDWSSIADGVVTGSSLNF